MGPLTPILMPRCVHSAAKTTFPFEVLLCFPAVLACCAWVWFAAAAARRANLLQRHGEAFNFPDRSVDPCLLACYSYSLVISNFIQMLCFTFKTYHPTPEGNLICYMLQYCCTSLLIRVRNELCFFTFTKMPLKVICESGCLKLSQFEMKTKKYAA